MDLYELSESTRVVIAHCLRVTERFKQRICCNSHTTPSQQRRASVTPTYHRLLGLLDVIYIQFCHRVL